MSEAIDNQTRLREQRKEVLKSILRHLHAGRSADEVKGEFAQTLQGVSAAEIAEVEQALIAEGLPEMEIKRLCDVHVAAFREALDQEERPEATPGHPVHTLRAENVAVERMLEALDRALAETKNAPTEQALEAARERLRQLREYDKHYRRKEYLLFPILERHGFSGPSTVMWAIHDDIRAKWKELAALLAGDAVGDGAAFRVRVDALFGPLNTAIREMVYKEEHILFPMALGKLSDAEWRAIREGERETGYAWVQPGGEWPPVEPEVAEAVSAPAAEGLLALDTGTLTAEQVNLLLTHLPVDVTLVDEADEVRYFSRGRERIFERTPAIIGRKVQMCHPPASVHRVQQILDDFRAGRRDSAEFWIQMRGRFIFIRYVALRDAAGAYRGTLEVTQDITRLRTLEGERRLLDGAIQ